MTTEREERETVGTGERSDSSTSRRTDRSLAVVTGASSGIGFELARHCVEQGFDLIAAADMADIETVAERLGADSSRVEAIRADLATSDGVDALYEAIGGRRVDALLANAGHGLGHAFLDQDFNDIRHVIDTNITGTLDLLYRVGGDMQRAGAGKILITGSIAGHMPGTFQAVYNGSKAFLDSFAAAFRNELKDSGVTVTCLQPGATDTHFFERADLTDTKVGQGEKSDPADVARAGFEAMMAGDAEVIAGWKNKLQVAMASVTPNTVLAEQHRKMAEPGSGEEK